jgi:hypothetical protein
MPPCSYNGTLYDASWACGFGVTALENIQNIIFDFLDIEVRPLLPLLAIAKCTASRCGR